MSSTGSSGNIGGTAGGNTLCNNAASGASLPGTYKAWLSTTATGDNPASSFTHSTIPYVLVDGTQVAADWTALTTMTLDHAINENEHGTVLTTEMAVWTGTKADGTVSIFTCSGWTDGSGGGLGTVGLSDATSAQWTAAEAIACENLQPLYCFEQ